MMLIMAIIPTHQCQKLEDAVSELLLDNYQAKLTYKLNKKWKPEI